MSACRVLVGHLQSTASCSDARETCKALRDTVDTGISAVVLVLGVEDGFPVIDGFQGATQPPLLRWPSCTKLRLLLGSLTEDEIDSGSKQAAAAGGNGCGHGKEGRSEDGLAGRQGSGNGQGRADVLHPGRDELPKGRISLLDPTQYATQLAVFPFQGIPLVRREQITDVEFTLCGWEEVPPGNLSHVLQALGQQLPRLQRLDLSEARRWGWKVQPGECDQEVAAVLAAAFPHLQAVALDMEGTQLGKLGAQLGSRLTKLQLNGSSWKVQPTLAATLPQFSALTELVLERFTFKKPSGVAKPLSEWDFVKFLSALPPSLKTLHMEGMELDTSQGVVGKWYGADMRLELGLRRRAVRVVRVGWMVTPSELVGLHGLLTSTTLAKGEQRLRELQLGGLRLASRPLRHAVDGMFKRYRLGRLQLDYEMRAEDMAAQVQQYSPEEVAYEGCVVRLRGRGPPPSYERPMPQWPLALGGSWAEAERTRLSVQARSAPDVGVAAALAGRRLQLEKASAGEAVAVAMEALRRSVRDAARQGRKGRKAGDGGCVGGLQLTTTQDSSCDLLLLVGPSLRMLGRGIVLTAWLKELGEQATAAWWKRRFQVAQEPLIRQYVRLTVPHKKFAAAPGVQLGPHKGVGAGAGASTSAAGGAAGADVAVLLQCNLYGGRECVESVLATECACAPCPRGSMLQGMHGMQILRLEGRRITDALHDGFLSPVLQALWDGSAGGKLGKQQRLEKLCALWGAVAWVGRGEKVPAYDDPEESESANELADKLLRKIGHML